MLEPKIIFFDISAFITNLSLPCEIEDSVESRKNLGHTFEQEC